MLWIGAVIGIASAVIQGVSANKNGQKAKQASDAAAGYAKGLQSYSEQNPYAAVQTPDISTMTQDRNSQIQAQGVAALQGQGAEGAGQITALTNAVDESNLAASEAQAKLNYQRDSDQANQQGEINRREEERDIALMNKQLTGAQQAAADAESAKNANINGAISSSAGAIAGLSGDASLDYLFKKNGGDGANATAGSNPDGNLGDFNIV